MKTVMAQGTFDVLHPGHIHYLKKSAELGDELMVVIARDSRVEERKKLAFEEQERREIVESLEAVDRAILGSEENIYDTVRKVDPDVITLGHDQNHSVDEVKQMAEEALENSVEVERIDSGTGHSSSSIKERLED